MHGIITAALMKPMLMIATTASAQQCWLPVF